MPGEEALRKWEAESQTRGISQVLKFEPQGLGQPLAPVDWLDMRRRIQQKGIKDLQSGNIKSIDIYLDDCVVKFQSTPLESGQNQNVSK